MRDDISSKSLGTATELLVIAEMRKDFVPIRDSITYATRLRILLRTLNAIRKVGLEEKENSIYVGPIDRLQTIYHVRWTVFEENRKMLLAVTFDRPLEPYVRRIVDVAGPVLDAILCHCEDYEMNACWRGHSGFAKWTAERQIDVDLYGSASPRLTVDDMTYLTELERKQRSMANLEEFDRFAARLRTEDQADKMLEALELEPDEARQQALDLIRAMYRLREYFPPKDQLGTPGSDAFYLQRLTRSLVYGFDSGTLTNAEERTYRDEIAWFRLFENDTLPAPPVAEPRPLPAPEEVQGGILTGHGRTTHGCLLLLRFGNLDGARSFLRDRTPALSVRPDAPGAVLANLAVTYKGLKSLGLDEPALRRFPKEFRDGMEFRSGQLGDLGGNHPKNWCLPKHPKTGLSVRMSSVDVAVELQTASDVAHNDLDAADHPLRAALDDWAEAASANDVEILSVEPQQRTWDPEDGRYAVEHFGFRDGISQPRVVGVGEARGRDDVPAGNVLLGHANSRGDPDSDHSHPLDALLDNGTYLVIRKLRQDVKAFRDFLGEAGAGAGRDVLQTKMMGRSTDGTPLIPAHKLPSIGADLNDFDYADDPDGEVCPFHAHVRRANPRLPARPRSEGGPVPRLLRRGFSYGPRYSQQTANEDRGLFFMAYNASIAEQFEVIQGWINGANSSGALSQQGDAIIGNRLAGERQAVRFMHEGKVHRAVLPDRPFVRLLWGLYLFVPSMAALALLSDPKGALPTVVDEREKRGARTLFALDQFARAEMDKLGPSPTPDEIGKARRLIGGAWKSLLEDPSGEDLADEVWAYIRATGGVRRTPYGVLVGDLANVKAVFQDDGSTYSTREYWERMRQSIGVLYLGMDPCPVDMPQGSKSENPHRDDAYQADVGPGDYRALAEPTNRWIANLTEERTFNSAVAVARDWFAGTLPGKPDPDILELKTYAADIVGRLSVDWFGLPTDGSIDIGGEAGERPNTPDDLVSASYYFFGPRPLPNVVAEGQARGTALTQAILEHVRLRTPAPDTLHEYLASLPVFAIDDALLARILAGCTNGFVAATRGSFLSVMRRWITEEDLWRLRHALRAGMAAAGQQTATYDVAAAALRDALIVGMQKRSRPNLLHRVAVKETRLGGETIQPGEVVVVSLQSAAEQQPGDPEILFGGNYGGTTHACSGQQMALGVLLGMLAVILEQNILEPDATFSLALSER